MLRKSGSFFVFFFVEAKCNGPCILTYLLTYLLTYRHSPCTYVHTYNSKMMMMVIGRCSNWKMTRLQRHLQEVKTIGTGSFRLDMGTANSKPKYTNDLKIDIDKFIRV